METEQTVKMSDEENKLFSALVSMVASQHPLITIKTLASVLASVVFASIADESQVDSAFNTINMHMKDFIRLNHVALLEAKRLNASMATEQGSGKPN